MNPMFNFNLKLYCNITSAYEIYQLYNKYPTKFIHTKDLTKFIIPQLPVLQETECNNICYMLKSQDKATVSTGLGTLQYYNFIDRGIDLLGALLSTGCYDLPNNREAEYIYSIFGCNRNKITYAKNYGVKDKIKFFMDTLNQFIVQPSMSVRDKVYTILRSDLFERISKEYKDEFERLNITLTLTPNDENREATISPQKVEREEI
jgi:hypothetical protein